MGCGTHTATAWGTCWMECTGGWGWPAEKKHNMNTVFFCFFFVFFFWSTLSPMSKKKIHQWSLTQSPLSEPISEIIMSISQIIFNLQYIHHVMQLWQSVFLLLFWSTPLSKKKKKTWPPLSEPISEISKFKVHIQTIHTRNSSVLVAARLYVHVPCFAASKSKLLTMPQYIYQNFVSSRLYCTSDCDCII